MVREAERQLEAAPGPRWQQLWSVLLLATTAQEDLLGQLAGDGSLGTDPVRRCEEQNRMGRNLILLMTESEPSATQMLGVKNAALAYREIFEQLVEIREIREANDTIL